MKDWQESCDPAKLARMDTAAKIASGVSAAVIAGLVAFAVGPALAAPEQPSAAPVEAPAAVAAAVTTTEAEEAEDAEVPEGYEEVGDGVAIPEGGPGACTSSVHLDFWRADLDSPMVAKALGGGLTDTGSREFAEGRVVETDENGTPVKYEVAPGDSLFAIGDRFCFTNGLALLTLNSYHPAETIQPGDVLALHPDYAGEIIDF